VLPRSRVGFFYNTHQGRWHYTSVTGEHPYLSFFLFTLVNVAILDICNDLILCWCQGADGLYRYVVCILVTKKFKKLQPSIHSVGETRLGFDPIASSHFHMIEYIQEEQDDECMGVDIYSSKTTAWICKESEWEPNTCVTFQRWETVYLNGCLQIMDYLQCYILAVDIQGETWRKIPRPHGSLPSIHQA
jgi:hypothetical protein